MNKMVFLVALLGMCAAAIAGSDSGVGRAKFTVKVITVEGMSIEGMEISCGFVNDGPHKEVMGTSDSNGLFTAECENAMWKNAGFTAVKTGYYNTHMTFNFKYIRHGCWEPWNPVVTAVVQRIVNPIPMYAKTVESNLPTTNGPSAYDLAIGDWVAPFGKGSTGDILFAIEERRVPSWKNFNGKLLMSFSNAKDGVQERAEDAVDNSTFGWRYYAPIDGYEKFREVIVGYLPEKGYFEANHTAAAYIRVRTVTNDVGQIVQANFGKLAGPVKFDVRDSPTGWIKFTYYLNPTPNDRNMEFDPNRNLFKHLKPSEQVTAP